MAIVRRIRPFSAFKVGLIVYGFLGLIIGAICALLALAGIALLPQAHMAFAGPVAALLCLILAPICYGLIGGIMGAIVAAFYNLAAGWVGGLEVDTL